MHGVDPHRYEVKFLILIWDKPACESANLSVDLVDEERVPVWAQHVLPGGQGAFHCLGQCAAECGRAVGECAYSDRAEKRCICGCESSDHCLYILTGQAKVVTGF